MYAMDERTSNTAPQAKDRAGGRLPPTLAWSGGDDGTLQLLDQTRLPQRVEMLACATAEDVWNAIRAL